MSTYTQIIYHIVFSTKNRVNFLTDPLREDFYCYASGIIKNKQGHLYRVNGTSDHVHILTSLHPTVCLSDFVKAIKVGSSMWIKGQPLGRDFTGWQDGYGAFTHSLADKNRLMGYINTQQEHHRKKTYLEELKELLHEAGVAFNEKYLP